MNTGLDPEYLMQCMFMTPEGRIGMMAQAYTAALQSKNAIIGDPEWIEVGDWSQVKGKWTMATSNKNKKYQKATYTTEDEQGLGVKCVIHWVDRDEPTTYGPYFMIDMHPRFSTKWAYDPLGQCKNRTIRDIIRNNRADLLHGMPDEEESHPEYYGPDNAKDITGGDQSPKGKLDGFAQKQKARRQARANANNANAGSTTDGTVNGDSKTANTKTKQRPKDDSKPHWEDEQPPAEGEVVTKSTKEMDFGDDDQADDQGVKLWASERNPNHVVERAKVVEALQYMLNRATSMEKVNTLFNKNKTAYDLLHDDERQVVKDTMDERARVLSEG
jgi:hypothetical protein